MAVPSPSSPAGYRRTRPVGRTKPSGFLRSVTLCLLSVMIPSLPWAASSGSRFFLMGDGIIKIKNTHNGREASVTLLRPDGSLVDESFDQVDEVFGFSNKKPGEHISPRLIFMLDYFSDLVAPGKAILLESGYRSPDYNSALRDKGGNVAKTSTHMDGMAIDFRIDGVDGKELWKLIKSKNCCGVGHYGGANVHLDSTRPRFWEASTSKVRSGESDHNRRIYLSSDYDRYQAGEPVRLAFSSVSDFGFGISMTAALLDDADNRTATTVRVNSPDAMDCLTIGDREASRSISLRLPPSLSPGRYRFKVDFCRRTSEQMPVSTISNPIEITGAVP